MNRKTSPQDLFQNGVIEISRNSEISFVDKKAKGGTKYVAKNIERKRVCKIKIDGGLLPENTRKCDFGLWVDESNRLILIELKGRHLTEALDQINETYEYFSRKYSKENFKYSFRIVVSKFKAPNLKEQYKHKRKVSKKPTADIKIGSQYLEETI